MNNVCRCTGYANIVDAITEAAVELRRGHGSHEQRHSDGAVGQSVLRREDDYLLRGQGRFVDDLPTPLNTLHLAFVLSPFAHARITSIDASEALALDGVVDVLTGADLATMVKPIAAQIELPGYSPNTRDVLAIDEVRFAGEAVAVVVAESQYLAEDGLELVDVDYEPLPVGHRYPPSHRSRRPAGQSDRAGQRLFRGSIRHRRRRRCFRSGGPCHLRGLPLEPCDRGSDRTPRLPRRARTAGQPGLLLIHPDPPPAADCPGRVSRCRRVDPAGCCSRRRRRIRHQGGPLPRGIRLRRARPAAAPAHQVGPRPVRRPAHRRPRP